MSTQFKISVAVRTQTQGLKMLTFNSSSEVSLNLRLILTVTVRKTKTSLQTTNSTPNKTEGQPHISKTKNNPSKMIFGQNVSQKNTVKPI